MKLRSLVPLSRKRVKIKLHDKAGALAKFIELKGKQEERAAAKALLDAKTIDGKIVGVEDDYLADLGSRYHLKSLDLRANGVIGKTNGNGSGSGSV